MPAAGLSTVVGLPRRASGPVLRPATLKRPTLSYGPTDTAPAVGLQALSILLALSIHLV